MTRVGQRPEVVDGLGEIWVEARQDLEILKNLPRHVIGKTTVVVGKTEERGARISCFRPNLDGLRVDLRLLADREHLSGLSDLGPDPAVTGGDDQCRSTFPSCPLTCSYEPAGPSGTFSGE